MDEVLLGRRPVKVIRMNMQKFINFNAHLVYCDDTGCTKQVEWTIVSEVGTILPSWHHSRACLSLLEGLDDGVYDR